MNLSPFGIKRARVSKDNDRHAEATRTAMEGSLLPSNALPVILKLATGTSFRTRAARLGLLGLSGMSVLRWLTAPKVIQVWSKGSDVPKKRKSGVGVNAKFYSQLVYVLRICIPTWRSKTFGILVMHTLFLVLRTYLSLVVATLDGRLVKDLVGHFLVAFKRVFSHPTNGMKVAADGHEFAKGLAYWFAIALPATYVNSMVCNRTFKSLETVLILWTLAHPTVLFRFDIFNPNWELLSARVSLATSMICT